MRNITDTVKRVLLPIKNWQRHDTKLLLPFDTTTATLQNPEDMCTLDFLIDQAEKVYEAKTHRPPPRAQEQTNDACDDDDVVYVDSGEYDTLVARLLRHCEAPMDDMSLLETEKWVEDLVACTRSLRAVVEKIDHALHDEAGEGVAIQLQPLPLPGTVLYESQRSLTNRSRLYMCPFANMRTGECGANATRPFRPTRANEVRAHISRVHSTSTHRGVGDLDGCILREDDPDYGDLFPGTGEEAEESGADAA
jgi:hypothetical protein